MRTRFLAAAVLAATMLAPACAQQAAAAAGPVPIERFFARPAMQGAVPSPSGCWLGALASVPGRRVSFHLVDLDGQEAARTIEASATDDVAWFQWASDDWVVFGLRDTEQSKFVYRGSGLLAMRRDGSDARQLVARGWDGRPRSAQPPKFMFLGLGPPGSLEVFLGDAHYDRQGEFMHMTLSALNIVTQKRRRIHEDAPRATGWIFDPQGRPRLIVQQDMQQVRYLWAAADGDKLGPWREIGIMPLLEPTWEPAYIDGASRLFVTTHDAEGFMELRAFDIAAGKASAKALRQTAARAGVFLRRQRPGPLPAVPPPAGQVAVAGQRAAGHRAGAHGPHELRAHPRARRARPAAVGDAPGPPHREVTARRGAGAPGPAHARGQLGLER